jgi:hypothetical protein
LGVSLDPAAPAGRRQSSSGKCTRCAPAFPASPFLALAECCHDQAAEEEEGERFESYFALVVHQWEMVDSRPFFGEVDVLLGRGYRSRGQAAQKQGASVPAVM